jgi:hypothetical protein
MSDWRPISEAPEGVIVETKIDDEQGVRNVEMLRRSENLWFIPGGMYVYYRPTHFRLILSKASASTMRDER